MATWRQAVELAMTDEEIGKLESHCTLAERAGASGRACANAACLL
jgi:hypothetical protein